MVKDTGEDNFMSLEHIVEERLTELTNNNITIHNNVTIFADLQKQS